MFETTATPMRGEAAPLCRGKGLPKQSRVEEGGRGGEVGVEERERDMDRIRRKEAEWMARASALGR